MIFRILLQGQCPSAHALAVEIDLDRLVLALIGDGCVLPPVDSELSIGLDIADPTGVEH